MKLIDFRMSKVDVGKNPKATYNNNLYGSIKYIAFVILKKKLWSIKLYSFEANVYLLAMIYFKILSNKDLFYNINKKREILKRLKIGKRSKLP